MKLAKGVFVGGELVGGPTGRGKTVNELTKIKRKKWPTCVCLEMTAQQSKRTRDGWVATESGGVVTVTDPVATTSDRNQAKRKLKLAGHKHGISIWPEEDQRNVANTIQSGNTTQARLVTFVNAMKAKWAIAKTSIDNAATKQTVNDVTVNWPTTPKP